MNRLIGSTLGAAAMLAGGIFASAAFAANDASDWEGRVGEALGKPGTEMPGGVYRVGLPRTDLKVTANGVDIKPGFALGGWLAFKKTGENEAMVMGDLVLLDAEINPVMKKLVDNGVEITAVHNHLLGASPNPLYMHVLGHGEPAKLASVLHAALAESKTPLAGGSPAPSGQAAPPPAIDFDTAAVDQALGRKGKNNGGIYQVSVPRAEPVKEHGMEVPEAMGSATAINFQPIGGGKAAITGDFVMVAEEVNPVIKALRDNGIEVTALHSHMLEDQPRLFFMHFWAKDDATKLATGLKAALDQMKVAKS
jgi:biotin operon repressor